MRGVPACPSCPQCGVDADGYLAIVNGAIDQLMMMVVMVSCVPQRVVRDSNARLHKGGRGCLEQLETSGGVFSERDGNRERVSDIVSYSVSGSGSVIGNVSGSDSVSLSVNVCAVNKIPPNTWLPALPPANTYLPTGGNTPLRPPLETLQDPPKNPQSKDPTDPPKNPQSTDPNPQDPTPRPPNPQDPKTPNPQDPPIHKTPPKTPNSHKTPRPPQFQHPLRPPNPQDPPAKTPQSKRRPQRPPNPHKEVRVQRDKTTRRRGDERRGDEATREATKTARVQSYPRHLSLGKFTIREKQVLKSPCEDCEESDGSLERQLSINCITSQHETYTIMPGKYL
nr:uncharacterized protein LOC113826891 [Penaeus vannamei]